MDMNAYTLEVVVRDRLADLRAAAEAPGRSFGAKAMLRHVTWRDVRWGLVRFTTRFVRTQRHRGVQPTGR